MKVMRWICAGALVGLAGVIALSISAAPSRPTAGTVAATKAAPVVAALPATPAPTTTAVAAKTAPAPTANSVPAPAKAPSGYVPGSAGLLIAIDPETGEVGMPSAEQIAEMHLTQEEMVSHDGTGLVVVQHPNGMQSMDLQGRFQEYVVARKSAEGKVIVGCVESPKSVDHIQPAPAAGLEEE